MNAASERTRLPLAKPAKVEPPRWNHQRWGTLDDPIHKSHMSTLIGEFACTQQFKFDRIAELRHEARETCSGKTAMGTAAHETIARVLRHDGTRAAVLGGYSSVTPEQIRRVLVEEFEREVAGKQVVWYGKAEHDSVLTATTAMLFGLMHDMHRHVAAVELVESGFIAPLGEYWTEGHIDLIYRPREQPDALAMTDWKTGAQKPHPLALDHGFEGGLYANALRCGLFVPTTLLAHWRALAASDNDQTPAPLEPWDMAALAVAATDRAAMHIALRGVARGFVQGRGTPDGVIQFGQFPAIIRLTHLADYVPYQKKGKKKVDRPEDVAHWSRVLGRDVKAGDQVPYEKGQTRGAAWLPVRRYESDVQRLERMLRAVVGWVRFGRFVEATGEKCTRCPYRGPCLTGGYEATGDAAKELSAALRGVTDDATDELDVDDD